MTLGPEVVTLLQSKREDASHAASPSDCSSLSPKILIGDRSLPGSTTWSFSLATSTLLASTRADDVEVTRRLTDADRARSRRDTSEAVSSRLAVAVRGAVCHGS